MPRSDDIDTGREHRGKTLALAHHLKPHGSNAKRQRDESVIKTNQSITKVKLHAAA